MFRHILVVDDDPLQCRTASLVIEKRLRYKVTSVYGGQEAINILTSKRGRKYDLVLLDLSMPEVDGIDVLKAVVPIHPNLPIIIHTAYGDVSKAVSAIKMGAVDFIEKQDGYERMQVAIENALQRKTLKNEVARLERSANGQVMFNDIVGASKLLSETKMLAERASKSNIPVLINGESGVGKELFARAIHGTSMRAGEPFVAVNCGAIPENLVESILFGHEKGAFTGAIGKTIGKFREANGGTIFLDEIGELQPSMQLKLLRVIQESEVDPVGADATVDINVRIISATNRNLKQAVNEGQFREDLFYRVNVFPFTIPSLRSRKNDINLLLDYFMNNIAITENRSIKGFTERVRKVLNSYSWPGNIRQLENSVYRAVVMCEDDFLDISEFSPIMNALNGSDNDNIPQQSNESKSYCVTMLNNEGIIRSMANMESEIIEKSLDFYDNAISKTARTLDIGRSTIYRKMDEYGIPNNHKK